MGTFFAGTFFATPFCASGWAPDRRGAAGDNEARRFEEPSLEAIEMQIHQRHL
jgi:hypothetical protein